MVEEVIMPPKKGSNLLRRQAAKTRSERSDEPSVDHEIIKVLGDGSFGVRGRVYCELRGHLVTLIPRLGEMMFAYYDHHQSDVLRDSRHPVITIEHNGHRIVVFGSVSTLEYDGDDDGLVTPPEPIGTIYRKWYDSAPELYDSMNPIKNTYQVIQFDVQQRGESTEISEISELIDVLCGTE